jgi:diacylglycerol kinase family enzyme
MVGLVTGRAHKMPDVRIVTAVSARIEGPNSDPVQADGDIIARLPVDLSVMPSPLPVILP